VSEQKERNYPVRHLDVERRSALGDCPAPWESLTSHGRAGGVRRERAEHQRQKRESGRRSSRAQSPIVSSRDCAGAEATRAHDHDYQHGKERHRDRQVRDYDDWIECHLDRDRAEERRDNHEQNRKEGRAKRSSRSSYARFTPL